MVERINVTPHAGGVWAVKHRDGYLGYGQTRDEAVTIGRSLVDWLSSQGRSAELRIERSFAPRGESPPEDDDQTH